MLLHIAWHDFAGQEAERAEGRKALKGLESILLEIAGVRLQPSESDLVLRSIDQVAGFLSAGEYTMAEDLVTTRLLAIIRNNKVARALYRPLRVLREDLATGTKIYLQFQIPDLPRLRDVMVTLIRDDGAIGYELRLDALGSVELRLSSGTWRIGLTYQPED